jgi:hypothetical protein
LFGFKYFHKNKNEIIKILLYLKRKGSRKIVLKMGQKFQPVIKIFIPIVLELSQKQ